MPSRRLGMRWGGDVGFSLLLFAIGALIVFHADRWILAFSYIFSFLFIAAFSRRGQLIFGFVLAAVDNGLRFLEI